MTTIAANTRSVRNAFWTELHPDPQALARPDVLAEHRPDHRVDHADPEPGEERRQRGRPAELAERLPVRRAVRAQQVRRRRPRPSGTRRAARRRSGRTSPAPRSAPSAASPNPNHSRNSGASATIGIVCDVTSSGSTARRTGGVRSIATAATIASTTASANPTTVSRVVGIAWRTASSRNSHSASRIRDRRRAARPARPPASRTYASHASRRAGDERERRQPVPHRQVRLTAGTRS